VQPATPLIVRSLQRANVSCSANHVIVGQDRADAKPGGVREAPGHTPLDYRAKRQHASLGLTVLREP